MRKQIKRKAWLLAAAMLLMLGGMKSYAKQSENRLVSLDANVYEDDGRYTNYLVTGFSRDVEGGSEYCLIYADREGRHKVSKAVVSGKTAVFYIKEETGKYQLVSVSYKKDGKTFYFSIPSAHKEYETVDTSFTVMPDEEEQMEKEGRVKELLPYLLPSKSDRAASYFESGLLWEAVKAAKSTGKYAVVIDPGHGGGDVGCNRTYDGVKYTESSLCLQIAKSCKKALEKKKNITVFLTRSTDVYVDFTARTKLAADNNAALLVSFHLNATGTTETSATGCEAIYQNGNYNATVAAWSKQLAQTMVNKLTEKGLKSRGIYYKNSAALKYPDGSIADNFAINRLCKQLGVPGIILEHCFLNNPSDFNNYLITEDKTAILGKADAESIAEYLSLEHEAPKPDKPKSVKPSGMSQLRVKIRYAYKGTTVPTGFELYRSTKSKGEYTKVANGGAKDTYMIDNSGVPGTTYYYKVRAVIKTASGYSYGDFSAVVAYTVLDIPVFTACEQTSESAVLLNWNSVLAADGYEVYAANSLKGTYSLLDKVTTTAYTDTTAGGKTKFYKVRAYHTLSKRTAYSRYTEIRIKGTKLLSAQREQKDCVVLEWEKQAGVSGYRLYRKTAGSEYVLLKEFSSGTTWYEDRTVEVAEEYNYCLTSYVKKGSKVAESFGSEQKVPGGVEAPRITTTQTDMKKVTISWEQAKGAQGYEVFRLQSAAEPLSNENRLAVVKGDKTTYTDTKANTEKPIYCVRAYRKNNGQEIYSEDNEMVLGGTVLRMILSYGDSKLKVVWKKTGGIDGYRLYRSEKKNSGFKLVKSFENDRNICVNSGRSADKTYYYRIQTYRYEEVDGEKKIITSRSTEVLSGKIKKAPEMKKVSVDKEGYLTVQFKKLSAVKGYQIYRSSTEDGSYKKIASTTKTSYKDLASKNKKYFYKVRGYYVVDGFYGYTAFSKTAGNGVISVKLDTPAVTVSVITENKKKLTKLSWNEVKEATGYEVYRSVTGQEDDFVRVAEEKEKCFYTDETAKSRTAYYYRVRAFYEGEKISYSAFSDILFSAITTGSVKLTDTNQATVTFKSVDGGCYYELYRKASTNGKWKNLDTLMDTSYVDEGLTDGVTYTYRLRITDGVYVSKYISLGSVTPAAQTEEELTPVMGKSEATKAQMVSYFLRVGKPFPEFYSDAAYGGVATIDDFVQIILEEAAVEGVRPDLVAVQIYKETGYLQFGGDVSIEQCNFAGIGAVGNGAAGCSFPDVRTGIRAQVQHLKAYGDEKADISNLAYECVDPRFTYVKKGTAKYIEWLGIKENPTGNGWATAKNYGYDLVKMIADMKKL